MKINKYKITSDCIGCQACVEVSDRNFAMNDNNKAFVVKQPDNEEEEELCSDAAEVCPVEAIIKAEEKPSDDIKPVFAGDNVRQTLERHPELKDVLTELSPKFKKMQNPVLYNTLARFASFKDAAKVTGLTVCEILHTINSYLGVEDKLVKAMPECIKQTVADEIPQGEPITWEEPAERYIMNNDTRDELVERISNLNPGEGLVTLSVERPDILIKVAAGLGLHFNLEEGREYRLSVYREKDETLPPADWRERKDDFEILDVRRMRTDPFDVILKKAYDTGEGDGFTLIQKFNPLPLINMLTEMGFEYETEEKGMFEVWVYFYKTPVEYEEGETPAEKKDVVIQSATPVAYPIIMRLLQSDRLRKAINIRELKVWEETEKHLGWIVNKKADISFSALITTSKLRTADVKVPALFVWDNFVMLTRGYDARDFGDVKGREIRLPLFAEAPPAKITRYLMKASGYNPDEFNFVFGEPFGRPEEIYADFVTGKADTVVLREPEASYAVKIMEDRGEKISEISFNEIWNKVNPGFGSFPNAGIVFKGEFVRENPDTANLVLEELRKAIDWVNENRFLSAKLSFDMMRQPVDRVEKFLERVNFNYVEGDELIEKIRSYFDILIAEGVLETELDDEFYEMFRI
jgi:NitT/TauT family transport system substrate-binding protein